MWRALLTAGVLVTNPAWGISFEQHPEFNHFYVESSGALVARTDYDRFYRSTNNGAHWNVIYIQPIYIYWMNKFMRIFLCNFGLLMALMAANAFSLPPIRPEQPLLDTFYVEPSGAMVAGETAGRFFRSTDDGAHWEPIVPPSDFRKLVESGLHPVDQLCLPRDLGAFWTCLGVSEAVGFVSTKGVLYKCQNQSVVASKDGGKSWRKTLAPAGPSAIPTSCGNRQDVGTIQQFSGSTTRDVHAVTSVESGYSRNQYGESIVTGAMSNHKDAVYFTVSHPREREFSIQVSRNGGQTWQRQTFGLPAHWKSFTLQRISSNAIYFFASEAGARGQQGALYRSRNGKTAERLNIHIDFGMWVDVQTGPNETIYVITRDAIQRSNDGGKTWRAVNRDGIKW